MKFFEPQNYFYSLNWQNIYWTVWWISDCFSEGWLLRFVNSM